MSYVAVAHSMLVAIYHILKEGVAFKDLGADYYNQFNRERKINAYLEKFRPKKVKVEKLFTSVFHFSELKTWLSA